MRILVGLIGIVLSALLLVFRVRIRQFMGQIAWAEAKFGPGGTYTALLIAGVALFFLSLIYATDSFGLILGGSEIDFFGSASQ